MKSTEELTDTFDALSSASCIEVKLTNGKSYLLYNARVTTHEKKLGGWDRRTRGRYLMISFNEIVSVESVSYDRATARKD